MKLKQLTTAAAMALLYSAAFAQGSAGKGGPAASAASPSAQQGPGACAQAGPGCGMRFNARNTPGWSMMTPEERQQHHDKMLSAKSPEECKAYYEEHQKLMQERAKEKGTAFRPGRGDPCAMMQRRGFWSK